MPATGVTLELLNRIQTTKTHHDLADVLLQVAARFGLAAFAVSHYYAKDGEDLVELLLYRLPQGFGERFIAQNYGNSNPISRRARQTDEPFFWHDVVYDGVADPAASKVMSDAASAGMTDGFCIPVHMPEGERGLVSFLGGPRPQRGVGVIAPFDFALDRELWRWVPDDVSLHLTRTPYVPVEVSLDLARLVSELT